MCIFDGVYLGDFLEWISNCIEVILMIGVLRMEFVRLIGIGLYKLFLVVCFIFLLRGMFSIRFLW